MVHQLGRNTLYSEKGNEQKPYFLWPVVNDKILEGINERIILEVTEEITS